MERRLYVLIDESNNGILTVTEDVVIANQMRRGLLDARVVSTVAPYDPAAVECTAYSHAAGFFALPQEKRTEAFLLKRELIRIRLPGFLHWKRVVLGKLQRNKSFYVDIDWILARETDNSTAEHPSEGLLDYAEVSGITVGEAFEYFKLQTQENSNKFLMIYALANKHADVLNTCRTDDDIKAACESMNRDFRRR